MARFDTPASRVFVVYEFSVSVERSATPSYVERRERPASMRRISPRSRPTLSSAQRLRQALCDARPEFQPLARALVRAPTKYLVRSLSPMVTDTGSLQMRGSVSAP